MAQARGWDVTDFSDSEAEDVSDDEEDAERTEVDGAALDAVAQEEEEQSRKKQEAEAEARAQEEQRRKQEVEAEAAKILKGVPLPDDAPEQEGEGSNLAGRSVTAPLSPDMASYLELDRAVDVKEELDDEYIKEDEVFVAKEEEDEDVKTSSPFKFKDYKFKEDPDDDEDDKKYVAMKPEHFSKDDFEVKEEALSDEDDAAPDADLRKHLRKKGLVSSITSEEASKKAILMSFDSKQAAFDAATGSGATDALKKALKRPPVKAKCKDHGLICIIRSKARTVGNSNSGRYFLCCPLTRAEGSCGFQRWIGQPQKKRRLERQPDDEDVDG